MGCSPSSRSTVHGRCFLIIQRIDRLDSKGELFVGLVPVLRNTFLGQSFGKFRRLSRNVRSDLSQRKRMVGVVSFQTSVGWNLLVLLVGWISRSWPRRWARRLDETRSGAIGPRSGDSVGPRSTRSGSLDRLCARSRVPFPGGSMDSLMNWLSSRRCSRESRVGPALVRCRVRGNRGDSSRRNSPSFRVRAPIGILFRSARRSALPPMERLGRTWLGNPSRASSV